MNNDVLSTLKAPAIGLITAGALNLVISLLTIAGGAARLAGVVPDDTAPVNDAERVGYFIGTFGGYAIAALTLIFAPVIIYGAVKMQQGSNYRLARIAAILAIVPFTSCCFVISVPLGIWAYLVLSRPEVKSHFNGDFDFRNVNPPAPPSF